MTKVLLELAETMVHSKGWQVTLKQRKAMELLVAHSMLKEDRVLGSRTPTSVLHAVKDAQWEAQRDFDKALKDAPPWLTGFEWEEGGIEDESWSMSWTIDPTKLPIVGVMYIEAAITAVCELERLDPEGYGADADYSPTGRMFAGAVGAHWEGDSIIVTQSGGRDI